MLDGIRTASIIFNPLAGGGHKLRPQHLEQARTILAAAGIDADLHPTSGPGHAGEIAAQVVADGRQLIIVCGGDGTFNEVVNGNGIAGCQVPVALLPAGTANIMAKELRIPWNIPRAAALIPRGNLRRIALGVINTLAGSVPQTAEPVPPRYFICVGGAGADGALVHALDPGVKLRAGVLAYWFEGARQLLRYKFPSFRVTSGSQEIVATLVVVGRTKHYGGPFRITRGADLFSDEFELAIFSSRSALRYMMYLPACWTNRLHKLKDVHFVKTSSFQCENVDSDPIYAQVDGEPHEKLPIEFKIIPDALTLVVPEHLP